MPLPAPLIIVVGSGGVGKTTVAASLGVQSAHEGRDTLVMTFDPSLRLKDALGVGEEARENEVRVSSDAPGALWASLLDAKKTFDRLVARHAPDPASRDRILENRYYRHLAGNLAGVLEYMAVERLFEVARESRYQQVILDTPPTRQALDFLEAPERIMGFLDSGALKIALKPWFDGSGRLRVTSRLGILGRSFEKFLDRVVGLDLLREMAEFFQAFGPLYDGFRRRAREVEALLRSRRTLYLLVSGPGEEAIPDTLFFARRLEERGSRVGPVIVNRVHPQATGALGGSGWDILNFLGDRDARGLNALEALLPQHGVLSVPLRPSDPTDLASLQAMGEGLSRALTQCGNTASRHIGLQTSNVEKA
jgi:anion-transporting  ArsA/GET3 family ATPase